MQKLLLLTLSAALTLGVAHHATAQTKTAVKRTTTAKPAAAAKPAVVMPDASVEMMDLDLSTVNIPFIVRVPKGTVAQENEYGVPSVKGPGVNIFITEAEPKADALANMERLQGYITGSGEYVNVPTGNPLAMQSKSTETGLLSFIVAVEDQSTHNYYLFQGRNTSLAGEEITVASTKYSYAAALSARYIGK